MSSQALVMRMAQAADQCSLRRLAELDEQPVLSGEVLLALLGGELVAAMSADDGRVIADPFIATSDAVLVLQLRSRQLIGSAARPAGAWRRRLRRAAALTG